jgi:hypothetical protein
LTLQNYRELDRGTAYFHAHAVTLFEKYSRNGVIDQTVWLEKILWASTCYRLVNKIETFIGFGGIPEIQDWTAFKNYFVNFDASKSKFTGAHQTMGEQRYCDTMDWLSKAKIIRFANEIFRKSQNRKVRECVEVLTAIPNIGRFLAWQITCDLLESRCLHPCKENDYATLGKGADGKF